MNRSQTARAEDSVEGGRPFWREHLLACAAALIAGLLLRLGCIAAFSRVSGDSLMYGDIASNWLRHGVYGVTSTLNGLPAPPRPTLIRLPGYPLFLLLCFQVFGVGRYTAVLIVQTALDLTACALLAGLAGRLFGRRAALPALWLAVLCPFTALYVAAPLTETLVVFCIALAFYGLVRWRDAGAAGNRWLYPVAGALAYSILLRPDQGLLAAAILPAMLWIGFTQPGCRRPFLEAVRPALTVALLTLLPVVPWAVRNQRTFHLFQPLAPRYANDPGESNPYGFQRWFRTFAIDFASTETTYWPFDGEEIHIEALPARAFDSPAQRAATASLLDIYNSTTTSTPAIDARFNALALDRIHADRLRYFALLPAARVLNMTFRPRAELLPLPLEWWKFRLHPGSTIAAALLAAINLAYITVAAIAFHRRRTLIPHYAAAAPVLWSMLATIVLRSGMLLTLDNSETRYTLEFFPILIVFAASLWGESLEGAPPRTYFFPQRLSGNSKGLVSTFSFSRIPE